MMAIINQNLASGTISDTIEANVITVATGRYVTVFSALVVNTSSSALTVTIRINDGADRLLLNKKITAGSCVTIDQLQLTTLSPGNIVKMQIDAGSINYKFNGSVQT